MASSSWPSEFVGSYVGLYYGRYYHINRESYSNGDTDIARDERTMVGGWKYVQKCAYR